MAKRNENKDCFVYTVNLILEPYQEIVLDKIIGHCCDLYNETINYIYRQLNNCQVFAECKTLIDRYCLCSENKDKNGKTLASNDLRKYLRNYSVKIKTDKKQDITKTPAKGNKNDKHRDKSLPKEFSFSKFGLVNLISKFSGYSDGYWNSLGLSTNMIMASVVQPLAKSLDKNIELPGKHIKKEEKRIFFNIARPKLEDSYTLDFGTKQTSNGEISNIDTSILWQKETSSKKYGLKGNQEHLDNLKKKYHRNILLWKPKSLAKDKIFPLCFEPRNEDWYNAECLRRLYQPKSIVNLRIVKRPRLNKYIWELQFTLEGTAPKKDIEQKIGKVGIDLGTSSIVAVNEHNQVFHARLGSALADKPRRKAQEYNKRMDTLRRQLNPDNYNEDGTIKKLPKGVKRTWFKSEEYKNLQQHYRAYLRKAKCITDNCNNEVKNHIRSMGNVFNVEDMDFKAAQRRSSKNELNKNGKPKRKKRFGKSILMHSPSAVIAKLQQDKNNKVLKVSSFGPKASQHNPLTDEYTKHTLSERFIDVNGTSVQRDHIAAYNLCHWIPDETDTKLLKGEYDNVALKSNFNTFAKNSYNTMINLVKEKHNGMMFPSCMGVNTFEKKLFI